MYVFDKFDGDTLFPVDHMIAGLDFVQLGKKWPRAILGARNALVVPMISSDHIFLRFSFASRTTD